MPATSWSSGTEALKPYSPPPPGAQPPPLWGSEDHLLRLLGDGVGVREYLPQDSDRKPVFLPEKSRDYFKERYGPTVATYRAIGDLARLRMLRTLCTES